MIYLENVIQLLLWVPVNANSPFLILFNYDRLNKIVNMNNNITEKTVTIILPCM